MVGAARLKFVGLMASGWLVDDDGVSELIEIRELAAVVIKVRSGSCSMFNVD